MNKTLVVCSTASGMLQEPTSEVMTALAMSGVPIVYKKGLVDVALTRNLALTAAHAEMSRDQSIDTVLMVDDDMVFTLEQYYEIGAAVRRSGVASSGAYILSNKRLAARHIANGLWLTVLGFLCIPREALLRLASASRIFEWQGHRLFEFTGTGPVETPAGLVWEPEDFRLTRRLGGVRLLQMPIGHVKRQTLAPDMGKLAEHMAELERDAEKSNGP